MPAIPKLLSLALVFLICLTPLAGSAQREVVLWLLLVLAGLDAGAAVKTTVVAMEQVATWVAELLSVRVLPFYLALSALAWGGHSSDCQGRGQREGIRLPDLCQLSRRCHVWGGGAWWMWLKQGWSRCLCLWLLRKGRCRKICATPSEQRAAAWRFPCGAASRRRAKTR